jgi:hypothetical protein
MRISVRQRQIGEFTTKSLTYDARPPACSTEMIICEQVPMSGNSWNQETNEPNPAGEKERFGKAKQHHRELKSMLASGKLDGWVAAQPHQN